MSACKHKVSGTLSLPSRGAFHLSFAVLYAIGHWVVFRVGGWSPRLPTGFLVPRGTLDPVPVSFAFDYMALTFYGRPSQTFLLANLTFLTVRNPKHIATLGLASSDFARHYFRNLG